VDGGCECHADRERKRDRGHRRGRSQVQYSAAGCERARDHVPDDSHEPYTRRHLVRQWHAARHQEPVHEPRWLGLLRRSAIEGTSDYDAGSSDDLHNRKIETFDFEALVGEFGTWLTSHPGMTWALSNALGLHRLSGSDTAAIGGDLAYRYNRFGSLSDISFTPATAILGASTFGSASQALQSLGSLQDASTRLS
jgi:hypothetical protein